MGRSTHKFAILFGIALWVAFANAQNRGKCAYVYKGADCSPGDEEVFHDIIEKPYVPNTARLCCTKGSDSLKSEQDRAASCRATKCEQPMEGEMCNKLLFKRVLKGNTTHLDYEEIMRDTCKMDNGQPGAVGLCCVRGSAEAVLMTLKGAELNEFPHQAKLLLPGHCGGTIYNSKWIITAAHCIVNAKTGHVDPESKMKVLLGTNNAMLDEGENSIYTYKVKRAISHEDYSRLWNNTEFITKGPDDSGIFNDIALLELEKEITFNSKVKALEMAPEGFDPFKYADNAVIIGWGRDERNKPSAHLHKSNFILRNDTDCSKVWSYRVKGHLDEMLCVGGVMHGRWSSTAGKGDSGGPAICKNSDGHPVHCGVTSFGGDKPTCEKTETEEDCKPSIYTEVAYYRDWIKGHAGEQDPSQFYRPILYGKKAQKGEADHQVHITSADGKSCGGTLIAEDMVLTAQQCIMKPDGTGYGDVMVTTGSYDLSKPGKTFEVAGAIPLDGFKMMGKPVDVKKQGQRVYLTDNYYKNDLALLKLKGKVRGVKFPELPKDGTVFEKGVELAFPRDIKKRGAHLLSHDFKILEHNDCQRRMDRLSQTKLGKTKVDENILCGVEKYSGGSICDRELGGGLICKGANGKDVLCGVQIYRTCELSVPNGFFNLAYEGMPDWVDAAKDAAKQFQRK